MNNMAYLRSAFATFWCLATVMPAYAEELIIPSMTYRTGPYASGGVPWSDGFSDYLTLLNVRDGGIEGVPIKVIECDFGYDTKKGVACFDDLVAQGGLIFNPLSTGVTYAIMDRAHKDGIPIHTAGYGLTAAADGATFRYAFNFPAHYWHGANTQIAHIKDIEGGNLAGLKIMHLHHDSGFGREPIGTLQALAAREGFDLILNPVTHPGEDQTAAWEMVAAENPDYVLLWGWGVMNSVALKHAVEAEFPMDRLFGIWWSVSEADLKPLGMGVDGYKAVTFHAVGSSFRIFNDMNMLVYQAGLARGRMNNIGDVLYNRGVMSAIFTSEAVRKAIIDNGTTNVTRAMVRNALEGLEMTSADLDRLGMEGFVPPFSMNCENHAGGGMVAVKSWDARGRQWLITTEYYAPDTDIIDPQVDAASAAFAESIGLGREGC